MADVNNEGKNLENEVQEQKKGEKKEKKGGILKGILFVTIPLAVSAGTAALTSFCTSKGASKTVRSLTTQNAGLSLELNQAKKTIDDLTSRLNEKDNLIEALRGIRTPVQRMAEDTADKAAEAFKEMSGSF